MRSRLRRIISWIGAGYDDGGFKVEDYGCYDTQGKVLEMRQDTIQFGNTSSLLCGVWCGARLWYRLVARFTLSDLPRLVLIGQDSGRGA
jgi:hypothetical protein